MIRKTKAFFLLCVLVLISAILFQNFAPVDLTSLIDMSAILNGTNPANSFGSPINTKGGSFEYVVAAPTLFPMRVDDGQGPVDYIYMLYRSKSLIHGMAVNLVRRLANDPNSKTFPGDLSTWSVVRKPVIDASAGLPLDQQGVAFMGKIFVTSRRLVFDPVTGNPIAPIKSTLTILGPVCLDSSSDLQNCIQEELQVSDIQGYEGGVGSQISLTRVTVPSFTTAEGTNAVFNSSQGRVVAAYSCHQPSSCLIGKTGIFIQELHYEINNTPSLYFGHPIRIFNSNLDQYQSTTLPNLSTGKLVSALTAGSILDVKNAPIENYYHQNEVVSAIGNNSLILSFAYNSGKDQSTRPMNRDYPTYVNFLKFTGISGLLAQADQGFVDISTQFYSEDDQLVNAALTLSGAAADEGAIWSTEFFLNPYLPGRGFVFYESWGGNYTGAGLDKTRNSFYPGTNSVYLQMAQLNSTDTCHSYCANQKIESGKCLTAEFIGGNRHGQEFMAIERNQPIISVLSGANAEAVSISCADIGTSAPPNTTTMTNPNDEVAIEEISILADEYTKAGNLGNRACKSALHKGLIAMEWATPGSLGADGNSLSGKSMMSDRKYKFSKGEHYRALCSNQFSSNEFSLQVVTGNADSCRSACDGLGAGVLNIGYRPYKSELEATNSNGDISIQSYASTGINVSKDLFVSSPPYRSAWIGKSGNVYSGNQSLYSYETRCFCGPGQSMTNTMTVRRFAFDAP